MYYSEKINFHSHGGYYNDGNSHYWSIDRSINILTGLVETTKEDTYGGQLAGNSQFSHSEDKTTTVETAVSMSTEAENKIYEALQPLIETAEKYPHLSSFKWFSIKHKRFVQGRINKARKIAIQEKSDYFGVDFGVYVFILKDRDLVIRTNYEDSYHHQYWTMETQKISDIFCEIVKIGVIGCDNGSYFVGFFLPIEIKKILGVDRFYEALESEKNEYFDGYGHMIGANSITVQCDKFPSSGFEIMVADSFSLSFEKQEIDPERFGYERVNWGK